MPAAAAPRQSWFIDAVHSEVHVCNMDVSIEWQVLHCTQTVTGAAGGNEFPAKLHHAQLLLQTELNICFAA